MVSDTVLVSLLSLFFLVTKTEEHREDRKMFVYQEISRYPGN